jgi:hypothetical protein
MVHWIALLAVADYCLQIIVRTAAAAGSSIIINLL